MAEWFKAAVLKTVELQGSGGSNPSSSAILRRVKILAFTRERAPPRILVVDDDPLSRRILEQVLVSAGYEVESAVDGQEALAKVRSHRPDVIVTDWQMPRMDGLTLCRILKATDETRFTHVVMLSAQGETERR